MGWKKFNWFISVDSVFFFLAVVSEVGFVDDRFEQFVYVFLGVLGWLIMLCCRSL